MTWSFPWAAAWHQILAGLGLLLPPTGASPLSTTWDPMWSRDRNPDLVLLRGASRSLFVTIMFSAMPTLSVSLTLTASAGVWLTCLTMFRAYWASSSLSRLLVITSISFPLLSVMTTALMLILSSLS